VEKEFRRKPAKNALIRKFQVIGEKKVTKASAMPRLTHEEISVAVRLFKAEGGVIRQLPRTPDVRNYAVQLQRRTDVVVVEEM